MFDSPRVVRAFKMNILTSIREQLENMSMQIADTLCALYCITPPDLYCLESLSIIALGAG